ncbi:lipopolysaccharide biosynthesis protein [Citricoccus nitrophenolicus]|uniref:lipopolysaccharide biosynthesis protein n=1 Tax=Citricoccus nitrophenolicus TaxID=863575 RepID=UPI0039B48609
MIYLATPFIARLYGPSALGAATVFLATASILAPLLTLRMEFLIPSASESEAGWISRRALKIVLCGSLIAAIVYSVCSEPFDIWHGLAFWATSGSLAAAAVSIQMLVRQKKFRRIGLGKIANGVGQVGVQIPVGILSPASRGIEFGFAAGYLATWGVQAFRARPQAPREPIERARRRALMASAYKLAIAGAMNAVCVWSILISISIFGSVEDAGVFSAVQRLLVTPVGLVTASLLPVVTGGVAQAVRSSRPYAGVLRNWLLLLAPIAMVAGVVLAFIPETLLIYILGEEFLGAGNYLAALAPMIVAQILAGPLGQLLVATGHSTTQLLWDSGRFLIIVVAASVCGALGVGSVAMTWTLSLIFALSYFVFVALLIVFAKRGGSSPTSRLDV